MFQLHVQLQVLLQYSTIFVQECDTTTIMLPGGKTGSPVFLWGIAELRLIVRFCDSSISITVIISARKQFHYKKGASFGVVHCKMSCATSRTMPQFDLIQSEIKDHYKKSCDKYHGHYKLPCHNVIIS